jgi:hypothetical protein
MANTIKYSTGSESLALKKGNWWIGTGDVGKGSTSTTGYYNGITPPSGGYTIYLNKASQGPSIYTCANDTELISLTNSIAGAAYSTVNECLTYFAGQEDKVCFNRDYESIVTDGLVLNLDAGFIPSYPRSETVSYNLSNSPNGTLTNGVSFSSSDGGSFSFDGTDDYIQIPNDSYLSSNVFGDTNYFTLSCWAYFTQFQNWTCMINKATGGYYSHTTSGLWCDSSGSIRAVIGTNQPYNPSGGYLIIGYTAQLNTWYNVVGVADGTYLKLYINGGLEGEKLLSLITLPRTENSAPITVGRRCTGCNPSHNGEIANVMAYDKGLSASEVLQNYNSQKGRFGL